MERRVLGSVKYLWDVTVTHADAAYMRKYYETEYREELAVDPGEQDTRSKAKEVADAENGAAPDPREFARTSFRPLYYTMQYPSNRAKLEMSFDLTHYQPQFRGASPMGPADPAGDPKDSPDDGAASGNAARTGTEDDGCLEPPFERHVFQTIFLDKKDSSDLWTKDEISEDKIIAERWWKQQSHRWQHYAKCVPWMMFLNGKKKT
ncbi:hypothetical protein EWM64_g3791 [Hericium alpestre]|uniref:Uncharacterized protein n=1 Tax=Hericium alpestre TaxID=135208 RepID=A0A4Z0A200_9AGAM|nr:hypothetical protein EWM64_g3791 [Hericium alpestre]